MLNTDIRQSSEEEAAAWQRRIVLLAKLTNNAELHEEIKAVDLFAKSTEKDSLLGLLNQLESLVQKSGLTNAVTFQDLDEKLDSRVKIPFLDQEVDSRFAAILLSVCLLAPLLYLLSIMAGIGLVFERDSELAGVDWIFFLPGRVGISLAILWMMSPTLVLVGGAIVASRNTFLHLGLASLMGLVGGMAIIEAVKLRRRFYARLKPNGADFGSSLQTAGDSQLKATGIDAIET